MFGLVYLGAMIVGTVYYGIRAGSENAQLIKRADAKRRMGKNRANVYTDRLGATRDLNTGKRVTIDNRYIAEAKGKDAYMYNEKGTPIRNLSEEIRDENYRKACNTSEPGRTVTLWKHGCDFAYVGRNGNPYASGNQFRDLKNARVYVCRFLDFPPTITTEKNAKGEFYMDIKTGLLVRETDAQIKRRNMGKYRFSEELNRKFIDYFNKKQSAEGYLHKSRTPDSQSESEITKRMRLGWFYCNDYQGYDIV